VPKEVPVTVEWMRKRPPGDTYSTMSRFPEDADDSPRWSVVLNFLARAVSGGANWRATARFLVEEAPQERLTAGAQFELYEGRTRTAIVTVL